MVVVVKKLVFSHLKFKHSVYSIQLCCKAILIEFMIGHISYCLVLGIFSLLKIHNNISFGYMYVGVGQQFVSDCQPTPTCAYNQTFVLCKLKCIKLFQRLDLLRLYIIITYIDFLLVSYNSHTVVGRLWTSIVWSPLTYLQEEI